MKCLTINEEEEDAKGIAEAIPTTTLDSFFFMKKVEI